MIVMRRDVGFYNRKLPHILGPDRAGIWERGGQRHMTVGTALRMMLPHVIDVVGIGSRAFVPLMPRLGAFGASARGA